MSLRIAFAGFRHGHIFSAYKAARQHPAVAIAGGCEEDEATYEQMVEGEVEVTHTSYDRMLQDVACDIVAIGDYYGKRGSLAIKALEAGKHVLSDKPLCTSLDELERIEQLVAEKGLCVGCQLDMRDSGKFQTVRRLILEQGAIGEVHAVSFGGQHPLMYGKRARWYFEEGKHGGTINDIAIHALDIIPWTTQRRYAAVNAARNWNAALPQVPHFKDSAQLMLSMDNGCGVLGDVSYLAPDSFGYKLPMYWRFTYWGEGGVIEVDNAREAAQVYRNGETRQSEVPAGSGSPGGYFDSLIREIGGETDALSPSTADVLYATRVTLLAQQAADRGLAGVAVS